MADKTFSVTEKDKMHTIIVHGAEESLKWAITDKFKQAPVSILTTHTDTITIETRSQDAADECRALLASSGYIKA